MVIYLILKRNYRDWDATTVVDIQFDKVLAEQRADFFNNKAIDDGEEAEWHFTVEERKSQE